MPSFPLWARKLSEEAEAGEVFGDSLARMSGEHGWPVKGREGRETGGRHTEGHSPGERLM